MEEIQFRNHRMIAGSTQEPNVLWYSKLDDPMTPPPRGIWLGHPLIARLVARVLNRFLGWKSK